MKGNVKNLVRNSRNIYEGKTLQYLRETEKSHEKPDSW
jgi:hypothetical protein